ncbi:MAG: cell division protein ZapA [Spirochaeta sp.]
MDLLGTTFSIHTDEDPDYVRDLLSFVEEKVKETHRTVQTQDPLKVAIISALMIADELFQHRRQGSSPADNSEFSTIAQELIQQIDLRLTPETLEE